MADIVIPYALSDENMTQIKQIGESGYLSILHCAKELRQLIHQHFSSTICVSTEILKKQAELRSLAEAYDHNYVAALQKWELFKEKNKRILEKGERLQDSGGTLLDALLGRSDVEAEKRFFAKHKRVYDKLKLLYDEVCHWAPYSKARLEQRIEEETKILTQQLEAKQRVQRAEWDKRHSEKIKALDQKLKIADGYSYVVRDLKVTIDGAKVDIKGYRAPIKYDNIVFKSFSFTKINESLQMVR